MRETGSDVNGMSSQEGADSERTVARGFASLGHCMYPPGGSTGRDFTEKNPTVTFMVMDEGHPESATLPKYPILCAS